MAMFTLYSFSSCENVCISLKPTSGCTCIWIFCTLYILILYDSKKSRLNDFWLCNKKNDNNKIRCISPNYFGGESILDCSLANLKISGKEERMQTNTTVYQTNSAYFIIHFHSPHHFFFLISMSFPEIDMPYLVLDLLWISQCEAE